MAPVHHEATVDGPGFDLPKRRQKSTVRPMIDGLELAPIPSLSAGCCRTVWTVLAVPEQDATFDQEKSAADEIAG